MNTEFDDLPEVEGRGGAPEVEAAPDEAAHLDTFRAPEIEGEAQAAPDDVQPVGDDGEPVPAVPEQISKDQFWTVFQQAFGLPGLFSPRWKPLGIQPDEIDTARAASDAIYEIAEIYLPSLLQPGGDMATRLLACVPFIMAKAAIARAILAEMKAERIAAQQPANRNAPPTGAPVFASSRAGADPADALRDVIDTQEGAAA